MSSNQNGTEADPLGEAYFKDVVEKQFGSCEIVKFTKINALQGGENYTSVMMRVEIDVKLLPGGKIEKTSYLMKIMPSSSDAQLNLVESLNLFPKEKQMYGEILPKFQTLYKNAGVDVNFSPTCLKTTENPNILVMEDLKRRNFVNINRLEGMDTKHTEAVLEKIAQFHAASVCLYEQEGPYPEKFHKGVFSSPTFVNTFKESNEFSATIFRDCLLKSKICAKYAERVKRLHDQFIERFNTATQVDPNEFNVLNHGDLWCNNVMFQHDESGNITETYLVDLQVGKWGTPVQDLTYLLISSCNQEIKIKQFDYFIKHYHDHLVHNLKLLQYKKPIPTLLELQLQMLKRGFLGVSVAIGLMSAVLLDPDENANIENYLDVHEKGRKFKEQIYLNPRYVRALEMLFPYFDNKGILE